MDPRSTDYDADALTTTPSHRLLELSIPFYNSALPYWMQNALRVVCRCNRALSGLRETAIMSIPLAFPSSMEDVPNTRSRLRFPVKANIWQVSQNKAPLLFKKGSAVT